MQLLWKTQSQFTRLDQQQIFSDTFLILKFLFSELDKLEQFYSSSKNLLFRVQVRQNNRVFSSSNSSSSLQPWLAEYRSLEYQKFNGSNFKHQI